MPNLCIGPSAPSAGSQQRPSSAVAGQFLRPQQWEMALAHRMGDAFPERPARAAECWVRDAGRHMTGGAGRVATLPTSILKSGKDKVKQR